MGVGSFTMGQRFELDGQRHHITRVLEDERIEFENADNGRRQELLLGELLGHHKKGRLVFKSLAEPPSQALAAMRVLNNALLAAVTPAQQKLAALRLHFVKRLEGVVTTRAVVEPLIEAIWTGLSAPERELMPSIPHASSVSRWRRQFRECDENINALLDRVALKGNRESRLHSEVEDLVERCIQELYLTPERRNMETVLAAINQHIDAANLQRISSEHLPRVGYSCLRTRIKEIPAYDVWASRYGKRAADVKFRSSGLGEQASLPLERASIDHCRLDVFVVDEQTGLPLGRPWLTVILDECTRMVLGYSLSFDDPSAMTVMRALRHAMLPKDEDPNLLNAWPAWGVIRTLVVDNGLEFHGFSLDHATGRFGTTVQTCPRRQPWYKGKIERYFRTVMSDLLSEIPGRTFSNVLERGDYDSAKHAVITLESLNRVLKIWTVDFYHQRRHSALSETPAAKWARLIGQVDRHLPDSAESMEASFGKPLKRMLGHQGVQNDTLLYNSDALAALRHRHGERFVVSVITNDEDVGYLYVVCPDTSEYLKVPAVDAAYANGMTRWQHRKCREYANLLSEESADPVSSADAKRRIRKLIAEDMLLNPGKSRSKLHRWLKGQDALEVPAPAPASAKKPTHEKSAPSSKSTPALEVPTAPFSPPAPPARTSTEFADEQLLALDAGTANQFKKEAFA